MSINWNRFCEIINSHQTFLLSSHVRPDCDALGSELGMAGILTSLGKQVTIVNGDAVPPILRSSIQSNAFFNSVKTSNRPIWLILK